MAFLLALAFFINLSRANADQTFYQIQVPSKSAPFPEPLAAGGQQGFAYRGTKGWAWTPEQYLEEIPWLQKFRMNFLMNCYVSLFSSTNPWINEWWRPLPDSQKAAFANVIRSCREHGITFCFCMNPQLASKRPLNGAKAEDIDLLFQHYAWAQSQGVKWFSICVDDAGWGGKGPQQAAADDARVVNTILKRLREKEPDAQLIFCPGPYWGDGSQLDFHAYLQQLGQDMNRDVYVFWTGDEVAGKRITVEAARSYKEIVKHRLFLWDNYPVNDGQSTLNLGPVSGRSPDLSKVVDGYMGNPMSPQNQINRLPLATCADYAYNPSAYDPARSIGHAISLLCPTSLQQQVMKELVEAYPGFLVAGGGTGKNPVRDRFKQLLGNPDHHAAEGFLHQMEKLSAHFADAFPGQFDDAKKTLAADVAWIQKQSKP